MISLEMLYKELTKVIEVKKSLENTLLLVEADKILREPNSDHRLEIRGYSIRYQCSTKTVYVYERQDIINMETFGDINSDGEFPDGYIKKINLNRKGLIGICINL